ncbi:MAG: hypothetical protein RIB46_00705 [Pseudomonadales bacterium]
MTTLIFIHYLSQASDAEQPSLALAGAGGGGYESVSDPILMVVIPFIHAAEYCPFAHPIAMLKANRFLQLIGLEWSLERDRKAGDFRSFERPARFMDRVS